MTVLETEKHTKCRICVHDNFVLITAKYRSSTGWKTGFLVWREGFEEGGTEQQLYEFLSVNIT